MINLMEYKKALWYRTCPSRYLAVIPQIEVIQLQVFGRDKLSRSVHDHSFILATGLLANEIK
jgi:hypothetical protein